MKNMLGIKRISSILLVGAMVIGSSAMGVKASNPNNYWRSNNNYVFYDPDNRDEPIQVNSLGGASDTDPIKWAVGQGKKENFNYFLDGKEISPYTFTGKVKRSGDMLIVTTDKDKTKKEVYEETEEARKPVNFGVTVVNDANGETKNFTTSAFPNEMVNSAVERFLAEKGWNIGGYDLYCNGEEMDDSFGVGEVVGDNIVLVVNNTITEE